MVDNTPFYIQLDEHLRRRFWTEKDLLSALQASRPNGAVVSTVDGDLEAELEAILAGTLAPTESFGEWIADLVIGTPDRLDADMLRDREALIGAAYVAQTHGRRQQLPYAFGVLGESRASNLARTVDQSEARQGRVNREWRQRLLSRLVELEEQQYKRRSRQASGAKQRRATRPQPTIRRTPRRKPTVPTCDDLQTALASTWDNATKDALAFIPDQARQDPPARATSFLHVVQRSYAAGHWFGQFSDSLLNAWRSLHCSHRGKWQTRMSPEQLGALIGQRNRERYASDPQKRAWFRNHKGQAVTGNALRNYLAGSSERPLRECMQKLVWAFVPDGQIQILVEQKLWKLANRQHAVRPLTPDALIEVLGSNWDSPRIRRQLRKQYATASDALRNARLVSVEIGSACVPYSAVADESGCLLTPLVNPETRHIVVDVVKVLPADGGLLTGIDLALVSGNRSVLMRALVQNSGMPITRISELSHVHASLFQQWMRPGLNQRIDDRDRAAHIVNLLNPPALARWPLTYERIAAQNEVLVSALNRNTDSLEEALAVARSCKIPETYGLDEEAQKTYRAAQLLRRVFGRNSLTNLRGPQIGRMLATNGLGDEQTFKHVREGVRERGRKSARRASLEQAHFLANLLDDSLGGLTMAQRQQFVECVACLDLDHHGAYFSPQALLRKVSDEASSFTIRDMTREMMKRRGGLVRFSREIGISQHSLRHFISHGSHYLHHRVARRIARHGMNFSPGSEEYRQFVIFCTAAWSKKGKRIRVRFSEIFLDYHQRLASVSNPRLLRAVRAEAMGAILSQAALAPRELSKRLRVTQPVVAGWTSPRVGHFTSQRALQRFVELMDYEAEQVDFIQEEFGPSPNATSGRGGNRAPLSCTAIGPFPRLSTLASPKQSNSG